MKALTLSREAIRYLDRMPANRSRQIRAKIAQYVKDPASLANNVTVYKGAPGHFRLRVGDWRVIFREDETMVAVVSIGPRGSVYDL